MENWSEVYNLAESYKNQQQWQAAAVTFEKATKLNPDFFWSYHHWGDVLIKLQQWESAVIAYSRAVELDPDFFWSWHNLGNALGKLQQWEPAVTAFSRAVELDPKFFWSWYNLGNAWSHLQYWDRAIASYFQAIQLRSSEQLTYQKLAIAFKQRGSLDTSIHYYRQLIKAPDANSIFDLFKAQPPQLGKIAAVLIQQNYTVAAIVVCYMTLEIEPARLDILQQLTRLITKQRELEQKLASGQQQLAKTISSQLLNRSAAQPTQPSSRKYPEGKIALQTNCLVLPNQIEDLSSAVGWQPRPLERVEIALKQSFIYICAWYISNDRQKLIGFTRAVSDGVFHAMLLDIMVHPDFQGKGIGKKIVKAIVQKLHQARVRDITLFASAHMVDFYHKLGFISQPNDLQWMLFVDS